LAGEHKKGRAVYDPAFGVLYEYFLLTLRKFSSESCKTDQPGAQRPAVEPRESQAWEENGFLFSFHAENRSRL